MNKVAIVLTQGFADWEYALIGGTGGPYYGLEVAYFAPEAGQITSQGGLSVNVPQDLDALAVWAPDVVVIVGGTIWETETPPDISDFLRAQHAKGAYLAGICGGTLALARAGLLNDIPHTSNNSRFLKQCASGYTGEAQYQDSAPAVTAGRIITAAGSSPASFTAAVFEAAGLAKETATRFRAMMAAEHSVAQT